MQCDRGKCRARFYEKQIRQVNRHTAPEELIGFLAIEDIVSRSSPVHHRTRRYVALRSVAR